LIFRVAEQAKQESDKEHAENRLHGIILQKTELFMMATVRNSNPTSTILSANGGTHLGGDINHTVYYWLQPYCDMMAERWDNETKEMAVAMQLHDEHFCMNKYTHHLCSPCQGYVMRTNSQL
jgi:hypothetical protein